MKWPSRDLPARSERFVLGPCIVAAETPSVSLNLPLTPCEIDERIEAVAGRGAASTLYRTLAPIGAKVRTPARTAGALCRRTCTCHSGSSSALTFAVAFDDDVRPCA